MKKIKINQGVGYRVIYSYEKRKIIKLDNDNIIIVSLPFCNVYYDYSISKIDYDVIFATRKLRRVN